MESPVGPVEAVFIVGAGYSGSTLLSMLLGASADAVAVGELRAFDRFIAESNPCSCGRRAHDCSFWRPLCDEIGSTAPLLYAASDRRSFLDRGADLFRMVARRAGRRVAIDSSKWPQWAEGMIARDVDALIVHLIRHPAATVHSHRSRGTSLAQAIAIWRRRASEGRALADRCQRATLVRYEDMVAEPEPTLRRLCQAAGIGFSPMMLVAPYGDGHHLIAGNPMRFAPQPVHPASQSWQTELRPETIAQIRAATEDLATSFAYAWQ